MIIIKGVRLISFAIIVFFTTMMVHGSEASTYTYDQLINDYLDNSIDIQLLDIDNKMMELDYELKSDELSSFESTMNSEKDTFEDKKESSDSASLINDAREDYYDAAKAFYDTSKEVQLLEFQLENKECMYDNNVKTMQYNFEKQLWDYYKLESQLNLLESTKKMYADTLAVQETKFNLKLVTELDVAKAENDYDQLVVQMENLQNSLYMLENNIKIQLGIPMDQSININIQSPKAMEPINLTLDQFIQAYKANSLSVKQEEVQLQVEEDYYNELSEVYSENSDDYKNLVNNYDRVILDKYNYDKDIDTTLVSEYYSYQQAVDQLNNGKQSFELAKRQWNEAKLAYDAGLISNLQLYGSEVQCKNAQLQYDTSIINYNLALQKVNLLFNGILE